MKKLLLLVTLIVTTTFNGQTTILDFEPGKTFNIGNNKGSSPQQDGIAAANPITNGINSSANAVSITLETSAPNWSFPIINEIGSVPGGWNFTNGKYMQIKVLSEDLTDFTLTLRPWVSGTAADPSVTQSFTGVTLNEWFIAEFDYSGIADGWANRIDVWFNKDGSVGAGEVFYIDDITQSSNATVSTKYIDNPKLNVYPNPTNGIVNISIVEGINTITVTNVNGQVLKTFPAQNAIDISDLVSGVYFLQADNGLNRKIIKE